MASSARGKQAASLALELTRFVSRKTERDKKASCPRLSFNSKMDEQALVNTLRRAEDAAQLHDAIPASSMAAKKHKKH